MLDSLYAAGLLNKSRAESRQASMPTIEQTDEIAESITAKSDDGTEDVMLLQRWNGKLLAEQFKLPEMEVEIERAVDQVEISINARKELVEEKEQIEQATEKSHDKTNG